MNKYGSIGSFYGTLVYACNINLLIFILVQENQLC